MSANVGDLKLGLTWRELDDIEDMLGHSLEDEKRNGKSAAAVVWAIGRRTNPDLTFDEVYNSDMEASAGPLAEKAKQERALSRRRNARGSGPQ